MGAYNILNVKKKCDKCQNEIELKVQFKYGDVWQYDYQIGDVLRWGGNDYGVKEAKKVAVDGISENCNFCGEEFDYIIYLEYDRITSMEINKGQYDFFTSKGYLVLEK